MQTSRERWASTDVGPTHRPLDVLEVDGGTSGRPPILFLHENRGIDAYMLEVIHDLAQHGHRVIVPDLLTSQGGSRRHRASTSEPPTPRDVPMEQHIEDVVHTASSEDALLVMGFCFGGELAWLACPHLTRVVGLVIYYGVGPDTKTVAGLDVPFLGIYADDDPRVNVTVPATWAGLEHHSAPAALHRFDGTLHAFHNHHRPERYHARAAAEAWDLTLSWLHRGQGGESPS